MNNTKIFAISIIMAMWFLASCGQNYENITNNQTTQTQENLTISDKNITLNNESITITEAWEYTISGKIENWQIIVDVGEKNNVKIILDNVNVNNNSGSALYIKSGKATIELAWNSENILSDWENYSENSEDSPNATIYAVEDLIITGSGKLTVNWNYNDGINTKDDLTIENWEIVINSKDDGIRGKDSVTINNWNITITSGWDAIKSDHETKWNIIINNGNINIDAGSDGMEAYIMMTINDGNINISNSKEWLESQVITINGGKIDIVSTDDGINASDSSATTENIPWQWNDNLKIIINGGITTIDAEGDGIDSNGNIEMNGGQVIVYGATKDANAAIDYDGKFTINGWEIIAFGLSAMAQNASDTSTQNSVLLNLSSNQSVGSNFSIKDSSGNIVYEAISKKSFNSVILSNSKLKNWDYTYEINGSKIGDFTISSIITGSWFGGFGWGFPGGWFGSGNSQNRPTPPEGFNFPEWFNPQERPTPPEWFNPRENSQTTK